MGRRLVGGGRVEAVGGRGGKDELRGAPHHQRGGGGGEGGIGGAGGGGAGHGGVGGCVRRLGKTLNKKTELNIGQYCWRCTSC